MLWISPRPACSACEREESGTSGVPVIHRRLRCSMKESAVGHGPRSIHVGPREREDATPTRNVSIPANRAFARSVAHATVCVEPAADRSATHWTVRHEPVTRSLPELSDSSRAIAARRRIVTALVRLSSDPPDRRNRQPVAMTGVHPFTPLARPPLAWGLGPARECEQRASRARRLATSGRRAPSLAMRVLDDESARRSGANESRGAVRIVTAIRTPAHRLPDTSRRRIGCARRRNPTCTRADGP